MFRAAMFDTTLGQVDDKLATVLLQGEAVASRVRAAGYVSR